MVVVPVVIAVIFVLLYLTFGTIKPTLLVVGHLPFSVVRGIAALWIHGMNLNLSASVGFIGALRRRDVEWRRLDQLD